VKRALLICLVMALVGLGFSAWAWPQLPDPMPIHWGAGGEANGWGPRWVGALLTPALTFLLPAFILLVIRLDPRKEHIERSRGALAWIIGGLACFMLVVHLITLRAALTGANLSIRVMMPAMAALFVVLGLAMPKMKSNFFAGIRTPWTLSSEKVWHKTHRLGGMTMVAGGLVAGLAGLALPTETGFWIAMGAILLGSMVPVIYSYFAWRTEQAA